MHLHLCRFLNNHFLLNKIDNENRIKRVAVYQNIEFAEYLMLPTTKMQSLDAISRR